jgi:hypothetical protein
MGFIIKAIGSMLIMGSVVGLGLVGSQFAEKLNVTDRLLQAEKEKQALREQNEKLSIHNQKLAMANRLLKVEYQLARLRLKSQEKDPESNKVISVVEFWETDDNGSPLSEPREYRLHGDKAHVQGLVAKFEDDLIEKGDPLRGAAMFAFDRIHGNGDAPDNGYPLPKKRAQPNSYDRGGLPNTFEQTLWRDFWDLSNDLEGMKKLGLRAAHGTGVSQQLRPGIEYEVRLRSTGECTISILKPGPSERDLSNSQRRRPWTD